jgi:UDPglucose 6-dehydrogenase
MSSPVIGFVGMTHLGLVSGIAAAERGFNLVCFDPNKACIRDIGLCKLPVSEPQLDELLFKNRERLNFTSDITSLQLCDVVYVSPDVETDDAGQSDLSTINSLLDDVFGAVRADTVIVVLSQVPPGYTRGKQRPDRVLYYQVETLIFGRAVERALFPERYIIGCADPSQPLPQAYATFLTAHDCPLLPMRYESAELAKISINMCLVASVTTANTLAELCENIGADWSEIVPALKLDRRIGQYSYLSPGLGISGGNLERDLTTVCNFADRLGTDAAVVHAWMANSRHRKKWAANTIKRVLLDSNREATLAVWGLAYKENTHSIKNSPSLETIAQLPDTQFRLHDPEVLASVVNNPNAVGFTTALDAATGADALMILTPWPEYRQISILEIVTAMRGRIVLDPYKVLDSKIAAECGLIIYTLGQ